MNNCISDFGIDNEHAYWGEFITEPPTNVSSDTVASWEMTYTNIPVDGSINCGNLNYYYKNEADLGCIYHQFWSIDNTGNMYISVAPSVIEGGVKYDYSVSHYACFDKTDGTTNPTYVSVWLYYNDTDTIDTCQSKTATISPTCSPAPEQAPEQYYKWKDLDNGPL